MEMKVTPLHANGYESAEQWAMFHDTTGGTDVLGCTYHSGQPI